MRSLCVEVPLTKGEEVRRELQEAGLLRKEFGGRPLDRSFDLEIAFWTRDQLEQLADRPA